MVSFNLNLYDYCILRRMIDLQITLAMIMLSLYQEKQFQHLRRVIFEKYTTFVVQDQQLLQRQLQILEDCKEKLERRKAYQSFNNISLNITNISSIPNMSSTDESSFRNKFTEEFENSILNSALKEIKSSCSQQTFDTIMGYVMNNKGKQYEQLKKEYQKKHKECEQLSALIIIKQKDINFLERDLSNLRIKEDFLEEEKKKYRKRMDMLDEKEKRLHSAVMSLIFKEKLNLEGKRRYERQKNLVDGHLSQLEKIYNELAGIWDKILTEMARPDCSCDRNCWKSQIMRKCKEQLVEQRKILQQEEKQIQIEYQTLRNLSDQVKKVFIGLNQDKKIEENIKK